MRTLFGTAAVVATLVIGAAVAVTPALADGLKTCTTEPEAKWKSQDDVSKLAVEKGYEVRKIKIEGSCYEVYGVDKAGKLWEVFFNPATGDIVETEAK
jgi:hypothetical protein